MRPDLQPADADAAPPLATPAPTKRRTAVIAVAAVAIVLGATGAAAVRFMAGSDAGLLARVPATADVAFTVYLDPAARQKMNLMRMLSEFPSLGDEQALRGRVDGLLDEALSEAGLTHKDLDWAGSQVAGFVDLDRGIEQPQMAVLVAIDDEQGATAALDAFAEAAEARGESVTRKDHDGVEVVVGSGTGTGAAALVDGVMVLASDERVIDDVIATGRDGASLEASPMFTETMAQLPEDHLAMGYVNVPGLFEPLSKAAALAGIAPGEMSSQGIEGAAATLSAEPDGFAIDAFASVDAAKLTDEQRAALASDHTNALLRLASDDAFGVVAQTGLDASVKEELDGLAAQAPGIASNLERLGITGPAGFTSIVGSDFALEVTPGSGLPVGGAVMVTTTDPDAMRALVDRWARKLGDTLPSRGRWVEAEHAGVSFTYLRSTGVPPVAYGVVDDVAVIAASPDELIRTVELSKGGTGAIERDPTYLEAAARVPADDAIFFLNVADLVALLSDRMGPTLGSELDIVEPIATITAGASNDLEGSHVRVFVEIP